MKKILMSEVSLQDTTTTKTSTITGTTVMMTTTMKEAAFRNFTRWQVLTTQKGFLHRKK
jgi:hypothetical protein